MAIPHLAVPFRLDASGRFATVEQDSPDEVAGCVAAVILTPEGSRSEAPDFGTPRSEFAGPDADAIVAAVEEWEPRAELTVDIVTGLGQGGSVSEVTATIRPHL